MKVPYKRRYKSGFKRIIVSLCLALMSLAVAADYKDGFKAYIDGDYEGARKYWLKASEEKDAKSMFNLGLLHEQGKIAGSSNDKAEGWFRRAADHGYVAANYHLAQRMLERGGSDDEAIALIKASAEQGYAPANRYLAGGSKPITLSRNSGADSSSQYQTESWINKQRPNYWTIQLLAFKELGKVQAFIKDHGLQKNAAYFSEQQDGEVLYKLVYGAFSTKDKATFARQNLSKALQEYGPWLRPLSSVQAITKR